MAHLPPQWGRHMRQRQPERCVSGRGRHLAPLSPRRLCEIPAMTGSPNMMVMSGEVVVVWDEGVALTLHAAAVEGSWVLSGGGLSSC